MPVSYVTELPDAQPPTLGNGVEDEIAVDWTQTTDNGSIDIHYRETGAADWLDGPTAAFDGSATIPDLEDGEEYEVRIRPRTEHVTGDWTSPVAIVTKFPGATDPTVTGVTGDSVSLSWTDNSDNEDGFRIQTSVEQDPDPQSPQTFGPWSTAKTVGPNTTSTTLQSLPENRDIRIRIEAFTEDAQAVSDAITTTTGVAYDARGWTTILTTNEGDRQVIHADDILDIDKQHPHSALADFSMTLPNVGYRIEFWMTGVAQVEHYFSGEKQFQGYLERAESDVDANTTTLEGRGIGRDLKDIEISRSWTATPTWNAIEDVWALTDFDVTVHPPTETATADDQVIQDADTDTDFADVFDLSTQDTAPVTVENGGLVQTPTVAWGAGRDAETSGGATIGGGVSGFPEGGWGVFLSPSQGEQATFAVPLNHTIPEDDVGVALYAKGSNLPAFQVRVAGATVDTLTNFQVPNAGWIHVGNHANAVNQGSYAGGDVDGTGSVDVTVEVTDSDTDRDDLQISHAVLIDDRFDHTYSASPNANDHLEEPRPYPTASATTRTDEVTANATNITVASSWNDTSGDQAIAVSNNGGDTFEPPGGVPNTTSVDRDLTSVGTLLKAKVWMSGFGTTDGTPALGTTPQRIDSWNLSYTGTDLSVIDQDTFSGDILTVLQKLHTRAGYRFVIDHAADGKVAESFSAGDVERTGDWTVKNRLPALDLYDYSNRVVVFGALQDDGTRPKAIAEDGAEISAVGQTRTTVIKRPDIDTLEGVKSEARSQVSDRVAERKTTGELDVYPTATLPGYSYLVDWYGDGIQTSADLERVSIQQGYANNSATLQFRRDRGNDVEIVQARFSRETLTEVV